MDGSTLGIELARRILGLSTSHISFKLNWHWFRVKKEAYPGLSDELARELDEHIVARFQNDENAPYVRANARSLEQATDEPMRARLECTAYVPS